jgi:hypothetical protein
MTREAAVLIIVAVALVLIGLGVWAWWRRTRRDSGFAAPVGDLPADAEVIAQVHGFYVATTRHDQPLERLAVRGLGFRSRVQITVASAGILLELPGQPRMLLPVARLVSVDQATVAIDRVVERDGLTRVVWRIVRRDHEPSSGADEIVDTYLRPQDTSTRSLTDAIAGILPLQTSTTPTGSDA